MAGPERTCAGRAVPEPSPLPPGVCPAGALVLQLLPQGAPIPFKKKKKKKKKKKRKKEKKWGRKKGLKNGRKGKGRKGRKEG